MHFLIEVLKYYYLVKQMVQIQRLSKKKRRLTFNYLTTQQTSLYLVSLNALVFGQCAASDGNATKTVRAHSKNCNKKCRYQ
jgi:hypothetical protein